MPAPGPAGGAAIGSWGERTLTPWRRNIGPTDVPAPLGTKPTKRMPDIQVFGMDDSRETRAAQRFFRERRIVVSYVDLRKRRIAPAELRRFVERLGAEALLDATSRPYREAGLGYLRMDEAAIVERLLADARLLRLPLVRHGNDVTAGPAEPTWAGWLKGGT
jgi:arsenate reductase-like glutaredoxin family protein